VGCAQYSLTVWVTSIAMIILLSFSWFQRVIDTVNQEKVYRLTFDNQHIEYITAVENMFQTFKLECFRIKQIKQKDEIVIVYTANGRERNHDLFLNELYRFEQVKAFEV